MQYILTLTCLVSMTALNAQQISPDDMSTLLGETWTGGLTYTNYSDGKQFTIPVELSVTEIKQGHYQFAYNYPNEPSANSKSKVKLNKQGTAIGKRQIVEVDRDAEGPLMVTAVSSGKDNRKPCTFYYTYVIAEQKFSVQTEVQYEGEDDRFVRNAYTFTR